MTKNDEFTLSLMQNRELININQNSGAGRMIYQKDNEIIWAANGNDGEYYLAQFNVGDETAVISTKLAFAGISNPSQAIELWSGETLPADGEITSTVSAHGVRVYKITS